MAFPSDGGARRLAGASAAILCAALALAAPVAAQPPARATSYDPVSYTHLTLPTILLV